MIKLESTGQITRDGTSLNNAGDALKNNLVTVAEFQTALQECLTETANSINLAQAAQTAAEAKLAELVAGAKTVLSLDSTQSRVAAAQALLASVQATELEKKRLALAADIVAKQAELDNL